MTIFNQAMKRIFKNKIRLLVLLIMPVLFMVMFATQEERSLTVGFVDKDNSMLSQKLMNELSAIDQIKVLPMKEEAVYDKTVSYQVDYTIILEAGFGEKLIKGENPEVKEFYLNEKEKLFYVRSFTEGFLNTMGTLAAGVNFSQEGFAKALTEYEKQKLEVVNEVMDGEGLAQTKYAMGFLVQFMLYMSVITAGLVLEDKNSGVFYRVFYAPVTLKRYIAENLMAFLIVGVIQVTMIMVLMRMVFRMKFGSNPMGIYLLFILFSIVCVSLGMWVVSLFKKPLGAYAAIMLITTPLVMLGGCYWPLDFMPEIFQKIALFIPTTWVMKAGEKLLYQELGPMGVSLEVSMLLLFSGIFLAAGLFKKVDISK